MASDAEKLLQLQAEFNAYKQQTQAYKDETELMKQQWNTANLIERLQEQLKEIKIQPTLKSTPLEKSTNTTQPLFYGKSNENIDLWFFTTEQNLLSANIQESNKLIIASSYLRELAAQKL